MRETIQEWAAVSGRVDRERGVIHGVRILGAKSKNGREYTPEAMQEAVPLYEGAKVNVDHPRGTGPRSYHDRLGHLRNVVYDHGSLKGDLHANPKHAVFEQLAWAAEHAPGDAGLSHNVEASVRRVNGTQVVEAIMRVVSVDLVADAATNSGLFEHVEESDASTPEDDMEAFVRRMRGGCALTEQEEMEFMEMSTGRPSERDLAEFLRRLRD